MHLFGEVEGAAVVAGDQVVVRGLGEPAREPVGLRVQGAVLRAQGARLRVQGAGLRVQGGGYKAQG